jgi:cell wall-associated NlpC family hydrolase
MGYGLPADQTIACNEPMSNRLQPFLGALLLTLVALEACVELPVPEAPPRIPAAGRTSVARTAAAQVGSPYRWGGASPRGFDCSGLVVYSYGKAGWTDLPHSAAELERISKKVSLSELRPGDLLFFRLEGNKTSHVGIYIENQEFVHAPSGGKSVERVRFDHPYWGSRLRRAGRLLR